MAGTPVVLQTLLCAALTAALAAADEIERATGGADAL